jgi:threonine synthase
MRSNFTTHLQSAIYELVTLPADQIQTLHNNRPLWVRYDLDAVKSVVSSELWRSRPASMWRYSELLPIALPDAISLGETMTPLIDCEQLASEFGLKKLQIKDESRLPTGSFKSRGLAMAVSMAKKFGVTKIAIPTAGNAGGALAAYAARAGIESFVFMPEDTPIVNQIEAATYGARTFLVNGLITDCGKLTREFCDATGAFDMSTLKEPYRIEGKKTMGLELCDQLDWNLPDVILYPTGGGTGLIGMYKAFEELQAIGLIRSDITHPRMIAVQSDGCCPIVRAYEANERHAELFENAATIASGLRVPAAVGDFMILDTVRKSGGTAVAVEESRINEWMNLACQKTGLSICPETACCIGALDRFVADGVVRPDDHVVIFNTGAFQKYPEAASVDLPRIDITKDVDFDDLLD